MLVKNAEPHAGSAMAHYPRGRFSRENAVQFSFSHTVELAINCSHRHSPDLQLTGMGKARARGGTNHQNNSRALDAPRRYLGGCDRPALLL